MLQFANLRQRLRHETGGAHEKLDHLAGGLDLALRSDSETFALAHAGAYKTMIAQTPGARALIDERIHKSAKDINALGLSEDCIPSLPSLRVSDEMAILYVVAGSHLGMRQLAKQRALADDHRVRSAVYLMDDSTLVGVWKSVVKELRTRPADGPLATGLIQSANVVFQHFEVAFERAMGAMCGARNVRA